MEPNWLPSEIKGPDSPAKSGCATVSGSLTLCARSPYGASRQSGKKAEVESFGESEGIMKMTRRLVFKASYSLQLASARTWLRPGRVVPPPPGYSPKTKNEPEKCCRINKRSKKRT